MSMLPLWPLAVTGAIALLLMLLAFEVQRRSRNAGYVDVAWAAGMACAALVYGMFGAGNALPRLLTALLGGIWGIRLSLFLLKRVMGEAEDGRYRFLRAHWSDSQLKFFGFFMAQVGLTVLFSLPFLVAAANPNEQFDAWMLAAIGVWILSLGGESLADHQLTRFRDDSANRGKTCRAGLWRYSRHPNYFFEWLHWFSYVLLAMPSPYWWLSLMGPLLMGISLCWITGIPFTEAQSLRSRGDDYRRYQQETSVFFPWAPKSRDSGLGTRDSGN